MRLLICNDDGIDAPGLRVLADAARVLGGEICIVAPERKWTAASHHVSFDADIVLTRRDARKYSCSGTPVDCVIAAMTVLDRDGTKPDLVLAGINDKRNVGEDVGYSGTIAIAREAAFWGVPAISLSRDGVPDDVGRDTADIGRLLQLLWNRRAEWLADGAWLSINLPRALPAPIRQASPAQDKIASAADVLARADDRIVYRLRRGRAGDAHSGDENALLQSGAIVVVRYAWKAGLPLSDATLHDWNHALE